MNVNDKLTAEDACAIYSTVAREVAERLSKYRGELSGYIIRKDGTVEGHFTGVNARVNAGAAAEYATLFSGTQAAQFQYIALSATAVTPASGDTQLSGEITTNGCSRALATIAYTAPTSVGGTYQAVFTKTFICSGSAQSVNSIALFNSATSNQGTMFSEIALSSQASLNPGDSLAITYTIYS